MGIFDDREKAQENKYFRDEELRFKAVSRRNKLFGLWAAGQLGLTGKPADDYAAEVVRADFKEAGDADILGKVQGDFKAKGIKTPDSALKAQLEMFMRDAIKQLEGEKKK